MEKTNKIIELENYSTIKDQKIKEELIEAFTEYIRFNQGLTDEAEELMDFLLIRYS